MGNEKKDVRKLRERRRALARRLSSTGLILQGSILERTIRRNTPARPGQRESYGPYYQWTRKIAGKTVNVNLTAQQAKAFQKAMDENRKLEKTLDEMRELSLLILNAAIPGVPKRSRRKTQKKELS